MAFKVILTEHGHTKAHPPETQSPDDGNASPRSYQRTVLQFSGMFSGPSVFRSKSGQKCRGTSEVCGDTNETEVFWPKDLLPIQYPDARILVYGYDTRVTKYLSRPTDETSTHSHGKDLLSTLAASRALESRLIFIAHSLGGILVKGVVSFLIPNT